VNIIPNPLVLVLQIVPFLLTAFALYRIIFEPMLAHLAERDTATDGARAEAEALQEKITAQLAEQEARMADAQAEIRKMRAARRAEAMSSYNAEVDAARKEAETTVSAALEQLQKEEEEARGQLANTSKRLADQISDSILQTLAS